jgi:hypothetical protein
MRTTGTTPFFNPTVEPRTFGKAVNADARKLKELLSHEANDMPLCFTDLHCSEQNIVGFNGRPLAKVSNPLSLAGFTLAWFYEGERNYKR